MRQCFSNICLFAAFISASIGSVLAQSDKSIRVSDSLTIIPLSANTFIHSSDQTLAPFGRFTSNGLVYVKNCEAIVMDTPPSAAQSEQLLGWLYRRFPGLKVKAIVVNHFHSDALGGLWVFHKSGIKSYGHALVPKLLTSKKDTLTAPQNVFDGRLVLKLGGSKVMSYYFGEAHTRDNIVTWIEDEKILFGGCMIKALKAGRGNLADANVGEWSNTVSKIAKKFPDAVAVVPGHGDHGGVELLQYTIDMFR